MIFKLNNHTKKINLFIFIQKFFQKRTVYRFIVILLTDFSACVSEMVYVSMVVKVVVLVKLVGTIFVQLSAVSGTVSEGVCTGFKKNAEKLTHNPNADATTCPTNAP